MNSKGELINAEWLSNNPIPVLKQRKSQAVPGPQGKVRYWGAGLALAQMQGLSPVLQVAMFSVPATQGPPYPGASPYTPPCLDMPNAQLQHT